jgi:hypothetical protein
MQQKAKRDDNKQRQARARCGRHEQITARADGDDNEDDLDAFQHDNLERGGDRDPVERGNNRAKAAKLRGFLGVGGLSSCSGMMPAARKTALRSQRKPKRSKSAPTTSCTMLSGMRASAGPSAAVNGETKAGSEQRVAPTAHGPNGQHYGKGFDTFYQRGEKCGGGSAGMCPSQINHIQPPQLPSVEGGAGPIGGS